MIQLQDLEAIDRSKTKEVFNVFFEQQDAPEYRKHEGVWPKIKFLITSEGKLGEYQFTVVDLGDTIRVVEMMHNDHEHLRGKGIGPAMIKYVHELYKKPVTSSSNITENQVDIPECREPAASKVWDQLVENNLARYDQARDIFICE